MMKKKYDYHSIENFKMMYLFFVALASGFVYLAMQEIPLTGKIFMIVVVMFLITAPIVGYVITKSTYIEINDDGLKYRGWKKIVVAKWKEVQEIKMLTTFKGSLRYKIYTQKGDFKIGMLEPADSASFTSSELMTQDRAKYLNELLGEIMKRAPQTKMTYSLLNRPL